jgi:uncharacterized integral membrane protein
MNRLVGWFVLLPLSVVLVLFALANRGAVQIGVDPISPQNPFVAPLGMPVFVLVYVCLMIGVVIGGISVWFTQGRHRRTGRRLRQEAETLKAEADRIRRQRHDDDTLALLEDDESR